MNILVGHDETKESVSCDAKHTLDGVQPDVVHATSSENNA
jgi:hypothetical protein